MRELVAEDEPELFVEYLVLAFDLAAVAALRWIPERRRRFGDRLARFLIFREKPDVLVESDGRA
jgi:hypothetical protein